MKPILVVGSIAFDSVETPFGKVEKALGGSATYFSIAATFFSEVRMVAVVGEDFPSVTLDLLRGRGADVAGIQQSSGKTFFWQGKYGYDLNAAETLETQLNVFQDFKPVIPESYRSTPHVFLANIDPELQIEVLEQIRDPQLVACDTMNFWIQRKPSVLTDLFRRVDIVFMNEGEARQYAQEANLVRAARKILALGPDYVVIKQGEYGSFLFSREEAFSAPAYPLEQVFDPTGAGDTFAGGFMGYLNSVPAVTPTHLRKAIVYGSVLASFNVEDFSFNRMLSLGADRILERYREFERLTHFHDDTDIPAIRSLKEASA